jgi:hypothetical protein
MNERRQMNNCPGRRPCPRLPWPQRARVAAVITVTAAGLLAAACGGSPSSTGSPSSAGSGGSPAAGGSANSPSALAFARCVRSHGVPNFPDPDSSGQFSKEELRQLGVSDSRLRAAEDPCQNLLPAGQAPLTAQQQQDYLKAAACMRAHGVANFPDPAFSGGGVHFSIPSSIDTSSAPFTQARQACVRLIPAGLPYNNRSGG